MTTLDDALLLCQSIGQENYADVLSIMARLDSLEQRGALGCESVNLLIGNLAELLVAEAVANDVTGAIQKSLTASEANGHAPETEDPAS